MNIFEHISRNFSYNEKYLRQICGENKNTHFMFHDFFSENRAVYGIKWKNMVERGRP